MAMGGGKKFSHVDGPGTFLKIGCGRGSGTGNSCDK